MSSENNFNLRHFYDSKEAEELSRSFRIQGYLNNLSSTEKDELFNIWKIYIRPAVEKGKTFVIVRDIIFVDVVGTHKKFLINEFGYDIQSIFEIDNFIGYKIIWSNKYETLD